MLHKIWLPPKEREALVTYDAPYERSKARTRITLRHQHLWLPKGSSCRLPHDRDCQICKFIRWINVFYIIAGIWYARSS
jgi:hypothetical protein